MSKYTVTGLPWASGLATADVSNCTTSREVMEAAGLDFMVEKCELVAKMPFRLGQERQRKIGDFSYEGNMYCACPNAYGTYRTDLNIPLGTVKSKYEVVQNIDAFNFFDDAIGKDKAIWQSAGYYGQGHRIFVTAKLPVETTVGGDKIDNYLVFSNSHDGTSSINILFSPIRVICTNMLNAALDNANSYIRIRHTKTAQERLNDGARILHIACEYAKDSQQLYSALTKVGMSDDAVMKYFAELMLTDEELGAIKLRDPERCYRKLFARDYLTIQDANISTRKVNQLINMFEYYLDGIGQKPITGTAWGAYNAVTGFYSNIANLEGEKRMDSLLYGNANRNMNKALNSAYELLMAA